jgi:Xaa-Pro dipeptidase
MISRRTFVASGVAVAAAAVTSGESSFAAEMGDRDPLPLPFALALPPAIMQLRSRASEAIPIGREERTARQRRARELMRQNSLDALVLMAGTSLNYFTGIRWWGGERLFAFVLPAKGAGFYVCPGFEEDRAQEQISRAPDGAGAEVRTWQEDDDPYRLLAQGLKDRGAGAGKLGIEETMRFFFADGIAHAAPQATLASATAVTAGCRTIKSGHEIALMRLAAQVTLSAYAAVYEAMQRSPGAGMTQERVQAWIAAAYQQLGFPGEASVEVDEGTAYPHGSSEPQIIREGSIVMIDDGCTVEGYQSDITRTFVCGRLPKQNGGEMKKVFDIVHAAQSAALAAARPGAECGSIDHAARQAIVNAGYGPDYKYFAHRLGHGLGMDGHEWPYLVRGNKTQLAANMTTSNEPGIYIRGEFGIRLEDDMHVTENGAELFTPQSFSLEEPFRS